MKFTVENDVNFRKLIRSSSLFLFFSLLIFIYFIAYLVNLQIVDVEKYHTLSTKNIIYRETIKAERGRIFDRNNDLIASNRIGYNLYIMPGLSSSQIKIAENDLNVLGIKWNHSTYKRDRENLVRRFLSYKLFILISINQEKYPYLHVKEFPIRFYPDNEVFFHPLGYTSLISSLELRRSDYVDYDEDDFIGKAGIEKFYENKLKGIDGVDIFVKDAYGQKRELTLNIIGNQQLYNSLNNSKASPVTGEDLFLTIDKKLQYFTYNTLKEHSGCAVVMNIETGEILALVSTPSVDPNVFLEGISAEMWKIIAEDDKTPLLNRTIELYNPASTFKIMISLAQLFDKEIKTIRPCRGRITLFNVDKHCWKAAGHAELELSEALAQSCNIYFFQLASALGIDKISDSCKKIGLDLVSGIDIPDERSPIIPNSKFKFTHKIADGRWYPSETMDVSIGQGLVQITPIKMLQLAAFVASKGKMIRPYIVKTTNGTKTDYELKENIDLTPILEGLKNAVLSGTAPRARSRNIEIYGKTGTMQKKRIEEHFRVLSPDQIELPYKERDSAWFVSFASGEQPKYSMVVFIEHGGSGGYHSAIISRSIWEFMKKEGFFDD